MQEPITYTVSKSDYFKFNIVHSRRQFFYYSIIIFLAILLQSLDNGCFIDTSITVLIIAVISTGISVLIMTTCIAALLFAITVLLTYFRSSYIYKRDKDLQMENKISFTDDAFTVQDERGARIYYYSDIYKIKRVKTLLIIYVSPLRAILIPASKTYNIAELYAFFCRNKGI